jgi:NDP-sugar pyrophosphorylase family protein
MTNISEIVAAWPVDTDGWSISPGVDWCEAGARIKCGNGSRIGHDSTIGDYSRIGDYSTIGDYSRIGNNVSEAYDIGYVDGYRKCVCLVGDVTYIGAGCRWFTLADAIVHWSNKPDRVMTLCLMESAKAIAGAKGWKHE